MTSSSKNKHTSLADRLLDMVAVGAMTWTLPGLGHVFLGHKRHGLMVGSVILFLWLTGLLVGGINVVDAREAPTGQRGWFVAQAGLALTMLVEYAHIHMRANTNPPTLAVGRGREIATLWIAVAGLLNVMTMADAMLRASQPKKQKEMP